MKPMFRLRALSLLLPFLAFTSIVPAADMVWTNTAGLLWSDPANWSPNFVPGPPDNAYITNAGSYFVNVDRDITVSRLVLGGSAGFQGLTLVGATLTLRNASRIAPNGWVYFSSGTLDGAGDLLVEGTLDWIGGTMGGTGRTIIPEGHTLTINSTSAKLLNRPLDLRGNGLFTSALGGDSGGQLTVFPGQTLELKGGGAAVGGFSRLNNFGTIRKSSAGTAVIGVTLDNQGLVQTMEGILSLEADSITSGRFEVTGGAVLNFGNGFHTLTNGVILSTSGSGRFRVGGGTLNIEPDLTFDSLFELNGVLTGQATVTFNGGLSFGGTMTGEGRTIIPPQASITGSGVLERALDLLGTWTGGVSGGDGATLTIFPGATFELQSDAPRVAGSVGIPPVLNNSGTIRKVGAGPVEIGFVLNNSGVVQLISGTLNLTGGGTMAGLLDVVNGATINFDGGIQTVLGGASFVAHGSGFFRINSGVFRVSSELAINPTFELTGTGILEGESNVSFNNTFNWVGGTQQGGGRTRIPAGSRIAIQGNSFSKILRRPLDLGGYGSISGAGSLVGGAGASLTILPTALFELLDDPTLAVAGPGESATLVNQGLLRKPEGAGTATIAFDVVNSGTVESQSGILRFAGGYLQTAGATRLAGGHLAGTLFDLQGGQVTGAGQIAADVQSAADIFPGSPLNALSISGPSSRHFTATAGGSLNLQLGGLVPGTGHDQLRVTGSAQLAGVLNVELLNGFTPSVGNSFTVMTYTARSGQFSSIVAPPGIYFSPVYSATSLVLNTVTENEVLTPLLVLVPAGFVGSSTNRAFQITMTGEPGRQYEVFAHTNVNAPFATWESLGLMTPAHKVFDYRDRNATELTSRFYRVRQVP